MIGLCACVGTNTTSTAAPTPQTTSAKIISPEPSSTLISPLVIAARIFPQSWSPDSQFLAYWTFTADEVNKDFTYPPGTLHFINARSGQSCQSALQIGYGYFSKPLTWLHDGQVLIITEDGQVKLGSPCGDTYDTITNVFPARIYSVASNTSNRTVFLLDSDQGFFLYKPQPQSIRKVDAQVKGEGISWSPSGERFVVTSTDQPPKFIAQTFTVDQGTGKVLDVIMWNHDDGKGRFAGPIWLNDDQFVIQQTLDRGPLFVTVKKDVVAIASRLFGLASEPRTRATAASAQGTSDYHIAVSGLGPNKDTHSLLYHSEDGQVEKLPFPFVGDFSPNGLGLIGYDDTNHLWIRQVEPVGNEPHRISIEKNNPFPITWSPNGDFFAISSNHGIQLLSVSKGGQEKFWDTGAYSIIPGPWAPNGELLAARGNSQTGEALFIIPVNKR